MCEVVSNGVCKMIAPIKQTTDDNCMAACCASLTGIDIELFPDIVKTFKETGYWGSILEEFLFDYGWSLQWITPNKKKGWSIAIGRSYDSGWLHAVVHHGGKIAFDPCVTNEGLNGRVIYRAVLKVVEW